MHLPIRVGMPLSLVLAIIICTAALVTFCRKSTLSPEQYFEAERGLLPWQKGRGNLFVKSWKAPQTFKQSLSGDSSWQQFITDSSVNPDADKVWFPGTLSGEFFGCDRSEFHTDVCNIRGDVRMQANKSSFLLLASSSSIPLVEQKIKPYSRKWEKDIMEEVREITLRSVDTAAAKDSTNLECEVHHKVPGVVFSTGGYTGNLFHEFNDGIIPLFITSQHLKGEVVFIITDFHNWWMSKYYEIIKRLSNYPVINFDNETRIHCFSEISVGLFYHSDLGIDPMLMPYHETMHHFRSMLDQAYTPDHLEMHFNHSSKPRLVFLARDQTRVILNQDKISELAEKVGFEVLIWKPDRTTMLKSTYTILNATDVVVGVHGAALTHILFMRPGSVFIQIIPLGIDWAAQTYFAEPAIKFGLQYIEYKINLEESTLSLKYAENDTILTNPRAIIKQGWGAMKEIYLEGQNIQLSVPRMQNILFLAKHKALAHMETEDARR